MFDEQLKAGSIKRSRIHSAAFNMHIKKLPRSEQINESMHVGLHEQVECKTFPNLNPRNRKRVLVTLFKFVDRCTLYTTTTGRGVKSRIMLSPFPPRLSLSISHEMDKSLERRAPPFYLFKPQTSISEVSFRLGS